MIRHHPNAAATARKYIGTDDLPEPLGWGVDGVVYPSPNASTAVKIHRGPDTFHKELNAYKRLLDHRVSEFQGFHVPRLVRYQPRLLVIEMSIVSAPFLLDFAASTLDHDPNGWAYDDDWWEGVRMKFGEDDFPIAQSVFNGLVSAYGIYYWDLKPGNLQIHPEK